MSAFPARLSALEPFWGAWYLDELLGEGSYGKVYRIRRKEFDKVYYAALKWVPVPQNEQEPLKQMRAGEDEASTRAYYRDIVNLLHNELVLMSVLRGNSNIVSYEDHMIVERKDSIGYDVLMRMELLTPLPDLVGKGLKVKDVVQLGLDMCSALMLCEQAHIVHRDIKPDNIFKSGFGHYKLGDFGVARQLERTQGAMSRKGTPHYMAPELMIGADSGKEVDQYSLGLVLHHLLNGNRIPFVDVSSRLPTTAERDEAFQKRMKGQPIPPPILGSEHLKSVVCKAAAYKAEDRYQDAKALRDALLACQADMEDSTPLNTALMAGTAQGQGPLAGHPAPTGRPGAGSTVGLYDTPATPQKKNTKPTPVSASSLDDDRTVGLFHAPSTPQNTQDTASASTPADDRTVGMHHAPSQTPENAGARASQSAPDAATAVRIPRGGGIVGGVDSLAGRHCPYCQNVQHPRASARPGTSGGNADRPGRGLRWPHQGACHARQRATHRGGSD